MNNHKKGFWGFGVLGCWDLTLLRMRTHAWNDTTSSYYL